MHPRRLKVLMSAYACEPGKGSEPEVGWQWCMQMARYHEITVVTRADNRSAIESALAILSEEHPIPNFVYFDGSEFLLRVKKSIRVGRLYYVWWQRNVRKLIADMAAVEHYDLMHHVTFAGFRYITAIWGHGVPTIWGPIGGMESIDHRLLPYRYPWTLIHELMRNISNRAQSIRGSVLPRQAKASNLTVVTTSETKRCLDTWNLPSVLMPTIGLDLSGFPERTEYNLNPENPIRLLFVGQLVWLKGADLAIEAFSEADTQGTLDFIGNGPFLKPLKRLTGRLSLEDRVTFHPRIPRGELLERLCEYDAFIFPSLHDSGGFAVIEAMASGMPVICLDVGGPSVSVSDRCGFRVPPGWRKEVVSSLADKVRIYDSDRRQLMEHGRNARKHVELNYSWDAKGRIMHELYVKTALGHCGPFRRRAGDGTW